MKRIFKMFLVVLFLFYAIIVYYQISFHRGGSDTKQMIDTCKYAVTYKFKYIQDTVKKEPYYDRQILEIGNKYSHFGSIWADKVDSIWYNACNNANINKPNKDGSDGINSEREAGLTENEQPKYEDYYTNYPNKGDLTVSLAIEFYEYRYAESVPKQKWEFHPDTATISGYKCLKATTTFRGRDYIVWFTPFIPVRQGPWKFNGLLGLILKAADTKGYFEWEVIGIEKPQNRYIYIHKLNKNDIIKTDRKNVQKLQRKQWESFVDLIKSQAAAKNITVVFAVKDSRPNVNIELYNKPYIPPLELE